MKIRPIQQTDDAFLYQLIRQILKAEHLDLPGTAYYDTTLSALSHFYQTAKHAEYFVLFDEEKNKVAGGVGIAPFSGDICELQKLYILPEYRGKGYSTRLLQTAEAFAAKFYKKIYLETHTNLSTALKCYERANFEALPAALAGSEHSLMNVWLIKSI